MCSKNEVDAKLTGKATLMPNFTNAILQGTNDFTFNAPTAII